MSSSIMRVASRVSFAIARRSVAAPRRVVLGAAVGLTAVAATTTTTHAGPSVATSNSRERSVAHVTSSAKAAAVAKPVHWAADADGINAQQRAMSKITSSDPLERLHSAQTRELLHQAYEVPGVVRATLANETTATDKHATATASAEEQVFLSKMEKEYGADVLPILRRQEWNVHLAASTAPTTKESAATLVCYFQEGTQRILYKRLSVAA